MEAGHRARAVCFRGAGETRIAELGFHGRTEGRGPGEQRPFFYIRLLEASADPRATGGERDREPKQKGTAERLKSKRSLGSLLVLGVQGPSRVERAFDLKPLKDSFPRGGTKRNLLSDKNPALNLLVPTLDQDE